MSIERASMISVTHLQWWTTSLVSFTTTRPSGFKFEAGQFARLGISGADGQVVFRAFSMVSSPYDSHLEFVATIVPEGLFSTPLTQIEVETQLWLEIMPYGYLTLSRFQSPAPHTLWMLATGTGVAPFLSIIQSFDVWQRYARVILVYSVRHSAELAYTQQLRQWVVDYQCHLGVQVPFDLVSIVTRPCDSDVVQVNFNQRIPSLIATGAINLALDCAWDSASSHVLICGNPAMVDDTKEALKAQGLTMNRRGEGNIAVENYW